MKFSLKYLFALVLLVACFFAGRQSMRKPNHWPKYRSVIMEGHVTAVRINNGVELGAINFGSDDGARESDVVLVFRRNVRVAVGKMKKLQNNTSVFEVVEGGPIRVDDFIRIERARKSD